MSSGFFLKKKPPFTALKKTTCILKKLYPTLVRLATGCVE